MPLKQAFEPWIKDSTFVILKAFFSTHQISNIQCNLPVRSFQKAISIFVVAQKEKQVLQKCLLCHFFRYPIVSKITFNSDGFDASETSSKRRYSKCLSVQILLFYFTLFEFFYFFFSTNLVKLFWQHLCHLPVELHEAWNSYQELYICQLWQA